MIESEKIESSSLLELTGLLKSVKTLDECLEKSKGEPTMSEEDVKLYLVHLQIALERQLVLSQTLVRKIEKLENSRPKFWNFWKK